MIRVLAALVLTFAATLAFADERDRIEDKLPRTFTGSFKWQDEGIKQTVTVGFENLRRSDGKIAGEGCGRYELHEHVTDIKIRVVIDPVSLDLELREYDPTSGGFETDGSHVGKLSADLRRIDAAWTSRATQRRGTLRLRAGGRIGCGTSVSREPRGQPRRSEAKATIPTTRDRTETAGDIPSGFES